MSQVDEIHAFFRAIREAVYKHIPRRRCGIGDLPFIMLMFDEEGRPQVCSNFKTTGSILEALHQGADWLYEAHQCGATTKETLPNPPHPNPSPSDN